MDYIADTIEAPTNDRYDEMSLEDIHALREEIGNLSVTDCKAFLRDVQVFIDIVNERLARGA